MIDVEKRRTRQCEAGSRVFSDARFCEGETEQADKRKRDIAADNQRIEQRRAVMKIQNDVGNEKRDERDGEFVVRRKISGPAKRDRRKRREVRRARSRRNEWRVPSRSDRRPQKRRRRKAGIIGKNLSVLLRYAMQICSETVEEQVDYENARSAGR